MLVLIVLLVIAGGVALAVWQPWREFSAPAASPSASAPAPSPSGSSTSPAATPSSSPSATATAAPAPSASASTIAVCTSGDIVVTAVTDKSSYGGDEKPQLSIGLVNNGDAACVMNVGTATQSFTIASGTDTWWRSTDCQTEPSDQIVQLEPGQSVTSVTPLTWDRTRSSVGSCEGDRPNALPGYYNMTVSIGGIDSEPAQFRLR